MSFSKGGILWRFVIKICLIKCSTEVIRTQWQSFLQDPCMRWFICVFVVFQPIEGIFFLRCALIVIPYILNLTIFGLKIEQLIFFPYDVSKAVGWVAISVGPDQTPRSAASDLDLHCLIRSCSTRVITVNYCHERVACRSVKFFLLQTFPVMYCAGLASQCRRKQLWICIELPG